MPLSDPPPRADGTLVSDPRVLLITAASLLALVVCYQATVAELISSWLRSDTYAHGMLIAPIVLFMVWARRHRLGNLPVRPAGQALLLLVLLVVAWLAAHTADVLVAQQFAFVAMVPALLYALLGGQVLLALSFPLAYLFFMVPVGDDLVPPLQRFTAWFTVKALQLSNTPVLLEGFYITIPSKTNPLAWDRFHVAEACSGSRYLIASVALGLLYAYLSYLSFWRRAAFVALAVVFPIVANGLRAYGIVMIAHHTSMEYAVGVDHLIYGWVFFGAIMLLMFWIGNFWRQPAYAQAAVSPTSGGGDSAIGAAKSNGAVAVFSIALVAVIVLAAGPTASHWIGDSDQPGEVRLQQPRALGPWSGPAQGLGAWSPTYLGADATVEATYQLDQRTVYLYLAYYRHERQGSELVNSNNRLYQAESWRLIERSRRQHDGLSVTQSVLDRGTTTLLLWHWYRVAGRDVSSSFSAKVLRAWDQLSGKRKGSALIAIGTSYDLAPEEAEALLQRFFDDMGPSLRQTLDAAARASR